MNLSVIIVSYNTKELLLTCLQSLFHWCEEEFKNDEYEVIVVDNGSSDGSVEYLEKVCRDRAASCHYIKNDCNLGFAKANNIGIKAARGDTILLLNSDTEIQSLSIQKTRQYLSDKEKVGVVTCRVNLRSGEIDPACHRGFPTPWNACCYFLKLEFFFPKLKIFSGYHQYYKDLSSIHEVDAISGAFFMIKRDVINKVGLLDEDYFMYGEDLDWCYRVRASGYKIMYNPSYSIIHHKKKSGRDAGSVELKKKTQRYFWQTMKIFYEKHYLKKYPGAINFIITRLLNLLSRD